MMLKCFCIFKFKLLTSRHNNCLIILRTKKHFASLHQLDRTIFIFPNTPLCSIKVPSGFKMCKNLSDFKIKLIRGGFQRRPELLIDSQSHAEQSKCTRNINSFSEKSFHRLKTDKSRRIQNELVSMALKLSDSVNVQSDSSQEDCNFSLINKEYGRSFVNSDLLPLMVLDIGCGDGMSMTPLLNLGHVCIGVDVQLQSLVQFKRDVNEMNESIKLLNIHNKLLNIHNSVSLWSQTSTHCKTNIESEKQNYGHNNAKLDRVVSAADCVRWDLRYGLPFKENSFDLAISISFLQWLFYGAWQKQLESFFSSLRTVLNPKGKSVIQFYPASPDQVEKAVSIAMKHFQGVLIGDYPHLDRGRKLFMLLF